MKNLRLAARSLVRAPRFTIIAVLTLALGIGATVTIFSLVNAILLRPLDYPDSEALVNIRGTAPGMNLDGFPLSAAYYFTYRSESTAFADMGFYSDLSASLTGEGDPEDVNAVLASHTLFTTLGVGAQLGRTFTPEEDQPGASPVVVLGDGLWRRRFGGDEDILGQTVRINGDAYPVVGVMPPGFDYPRDTELWVPARLNAETAPWSFRYPTVGRLAEGVTAEQAQAQLVPIVQGIRDSYPEGSNWRSLMDDGRYAPLVGGMKDEMVSAIAQPLWILLATVGFVLLIACTNVANLVLARTEDRQREAAVRAAVGATRGTLARQSLTESALLALVGGGSGLALAWLTLPVIVSQAPPRLPRLEEVGIDGTVLLFALGVTVLSILFFGIAPLLRLSPSLLSHALRQGGHRTTAGPRHQRTRALLVAGQAALALVLMVGSGLMVRSFLAVYRTDMGFDYRNLLTFHVSLPQGRYGTSQEVTAFHEEVLERVRALPGVEAAAVTSELPVSDPTRSSPFGVEGQPEGEDQPVLLLDYKYVSGDYAGAMGIPVLAGETLTSADAHSESRRIMVNQAVVDRFWPGEDPIGKTMRFPQRYEPPIWYTVAGVLGTVRDAGIRRDARAMVYFPLMSEAAQVGWAVPSAAYVLRGQGLERLGPSIHRAVWGVDPELPLVGFQSGEEIVADSIVQLTFTLVTLAMAAMMALILGAVGLFGILSYSVTQRRGEIAVHMAMGAEARQIMGRVVGDGARITALGVVAGLAGAWGLSRFLQGILFGVEAADPLTYGGMAAALLVVAVVAAYLPARKAASVDPAESMRAE
jgi:predicted permease